MRVPLTTERNITGSEFRAACHGRETVCVQSVIQCGRDCRRSLTGQVNKRLISEIEGVLPVRVVGGDIAIRECRCPSSKCRSPHGNCPGKTLFSALMR